jgi:hypothetical protein
MHPLLVVVVKVPEHGSVGNVRLRMGLVGAIQRRELNRVANEEDGEIDGYDIPVGFISEEFHSKPSDVTNRIGRDLGWGHYRDTSQYFGLLATSFRKFADVMCEMSCVTSNSPHAPAAFAWTVLLYISTAKSIERGRVSTFLVFSRAGSAPGFRSTECPQEEQVLRRVLACLEEWVESSDPVQDVLDGCSARVKRSRRECRLIFR